MFVLEEVCIIRGVCFVDKYIIIFEIKLELNNRDDLLRKRKYR